MNNITTSISPLLAVIYTREEAEKVQDILSDSLDSLYKVHHNNTLSILLDNLPAHIGEVLKDQIEQKQIDVQTPEAIKKICDSLALALKNTDLLTLSLAFEPSFELTQKIAKLIKTEFGGNTLIEIEVDPHVMGGAIITFKGQYFDYSLKTKIDHFLKSQ